jgi:hypothetical protein
MQPGPGPGLFGEFAGNRIFGHWAAAPAGFPGVALLHIRQDGKRCSAAMASIGER